MSGFDACMSLAEECFLAYLAAVFLQIKSADISGTRFRTSAAEAVVLQQIGVARRGFVCGQPIV